MISKKTKNREKFLQLLFYVFRGTDGQIDGKKIKAKHDHTIELVDFIGTNMDIEDPIEYVSDGISMGINIDHINHINNKFEDIVILHTGTGKNFCGHFILSLSEGEHLSKDQWQHAIKILLEELGYIDNDYIAGRHRPSNNSSEKKEHAHIIVNRLNRTTLDFVNDKNDYIKFERACRKIEKLFGLKKVLSSDETWNTRPTKSQEEGIKKKKEENLKEGKDINDGLKQSDIPRMKALLKDIIDDKKPKTMTDFIYMLGAVNMEAIITTKKSGEISGISYQYNGGKPISGSKLHRHKATWPRLQDAGIKYKQDRDNKALGLKETIFCSYEPVPKKPKDLEYRPVDIAPELDKSGDKMDIDFVAMIRLDYDSAIWRSEYFRSIHSAYRKKIDNMKESNKYNFVANHFTLNTALNLSLYNVKKRKGSSYIDSKYWKEIEAANQLAEAIMSLIKSLLQALGLVVEIIHVEELKANYIQDTDCKRVIEPKKLDFNDINGIHDYFKNDINSSYKDIINNKINNRIEPISEEQMKKELEEYDRECEKEIKEFEDNQKKKRDEQRKQRIEKFKQGCRKNTESKPGKRKPRVSDSDSDMEMGMELTPDWR